MHQRCSLRIIEYFQTQVFAFFILPNHKQPNSISCGRAVRVPVLGGGAPAAVPGPDRARPLRRRVPLHPPARALPRPPHPAGGRPQGGDTGLKSRVL